MSEMDFIGVRKYLENLKSKIRHASSFNITITKLYMSNNGMDSIGTPGLISWLSIIIIVTISFIVWFAL
jgi:hypothetical protein